MKLVGLIIPVVLAGLLSGCAGFKKVRNTHREFSYSHHFVVRDVKGRPVPDAEVQVEHLQWTTDDSARPSCWTDHQGRCQILLTSRLDGVTINAFTKLEAKISKPGYIAAFIRDARGYGVASDAGYNGIESEHVVLVPTTQNVTIKTSVMNMQRKPVMGSRVTVSLNVYNKQGVCMTGSDGTCSTELSLVDSNPQDNPTLKVTAEIEGMFSKTETKDFAKNMSDASFELILASPFDYLCDPLKQSTSKALPSQVARWVIGLQIQAYLQETTFSHGDVCTSNFKGKKYASINLRHNIVYNSLRSNNYQVGVKIFDEVIRKMIQRMANGNASFALDGYDISLETASGEATKDYGDRKQLNFRFVLPKPAVQKYIEKDITGQQLINQSIVLLNDERIDLHLQ